MIGLAVEVAIATFVIGLVGAAIAARLRSLRSRIAGLALVASIVPLVGVLGSGIVMFESSHDTGLALVAAAASTAALVGALLIARSILRPVAALGETAAAMGAGDLTARAATTGPAELAELARTFNHMAADVEALMDARRDLMAWASHDLRTPLTALQAMIEAVEDGIVPPEYYLPQMRDQVRSLAAVVDDLSQLALPGADAIETAPVRLDVTVPARVRAFEAEAAARSLTLTARVPAPPVLATCAEELVDRVLDNLLANALRYTPAGGAIEVAVARDNGAVEIAVTDSGVGIAEEDLERVFEPFYRSDPARTDGGAGLGLSIARRLVEAQGGRITARRRAGGGTSIAFTLPTAVDHGPT